MCLSETFQDLFVVTQISLKFFMNGLPARDHEPSYSIVDRFIGRYVKLSGYKSLFKRKR